MADHPRDAEKLTIQCRPGDLIITATDGLFDNINDSMILSELAKLPSDPDDIERKHLDLVARSLAALARRKATDKSFLSVSCFENNFGPIIVHQKKRLCAV